MEILKNCTKWYLHTDWSNQTAIGIIAIAIMALIALTIKYGLMKTSWSWLKIGSPWKIFGKLVSLGAILGICYGIYLFICLFLPTPEQKVFKELSKNLAEIELKPEKDRLTVFNEKVKNGERLTETEKREAMEADKKIERVRRDYTDGKLTPPPPPKPVSAKPKEEVWIFKWMATDELMAENPRQKPSSEYVTSNVMCSEKELSFVCLKGKRQKDKVVLTRNDQKENYMGYLFNKEKKEYTQVWLFPEKDYFKGYIFAHNGLKILATLKKQNQ